MVTAEGVLLLNPRYKSRLVLYALRAENRHYSWWINQSADSAERDEYTCFCVRSVEKQSHKQLISLPQQRGLINWAAHLFHHPHSSPFHLPSSAYLFFLCLERLYAKSFSWHCHIFNWHCFHWCMHMLMRAHTAWQCRTFALAQPGRNRKYKFFTQTSPSPHLHVKIIFKLFILPVLITALNYNIIGWFVGGRCGADPPPVRQKHGKCIWVFVFAGGWNEEYISIQLSQSHVHTSRHTHTHAHTEAWSSVHSLNTLIIRRRRSLQVHFTRV